MEIQKRCKYCGKLFIAHTLATQYCSRQCNGKDYKRKIREKEIADYLESNPQDAPSAVSSQNSVIEAKRFLTPREAALYLGIGKSSVYINPEKPDVPLNKNDAFQKVQKRRVQEKR